MIRPVVSQAAEEMYESLKAIAADDADNNWIILLTCEALMRSNIQPIIELSRDTDQGVGWSKLMDLDRIRDEDLPYAAQFVGVTTNPASTPAENRDLIVTRPPWKRGRPATLLAAVQATLTGTQRIELAERDTSAYHATITVYRAQVPDEDLTRAAVARNKPGMIIVDLEILESPTYGEVRDSLAVNEYGEREAEFPTYGDIKEFVP
jgi:hypothetical protein